MARELNWRKWLRAYLLALPVVAGIVLLFFYVVIPNSAGFDAAKAAVTDLPGVRARVGRVQEVEVLPFRPYRLSFVGSERIELLPLEVSGDHGQLKILIRMVRTDDKWRVESCTKIW